MLRWKGLSFVAAGFLLCTMVGAVAGGVLLAEPALKSVLSRDIDNPARQPMFFQGRYFAEPGTGYITGDFAIDYVVPADKRLVVEYINVGAADTPFSDATNYEARVGVPGGVSSLDAFYLGMPFVSGGYRVAQPLRVYYSPGDHFRVACSRFHADAAGNGACYAAASGYLVDLSD